MVDAADEVDQGVAGQGGQGCLHLAGPQSRTVYVVHQQEERAGEVGGDLRQVVRGGGGRRAKLQDLLRYRGQDLLQRQGREKTVYHDTVLHGKISIRWVWWQGVDFSLIISQLKKLIRVS